MLEPTFQQQAIIDAGAMNESLLIRAYAGTGKTTTIEMLAPSLPSRPTLAVAFSKRIQKELEKRLLPTFIVKTLNGLGHGALARALDKRLTLEPNKIGGLVTETAKAAGYNFLETEIWTSIKSLVNAARQAGLVPAGLSWTGLVPDEDEAWEAFADERLINLTGEILELSRKVLRASITAGLRGVIDYDDQIYMSTMITGIYTRYGNVLVDEAQDLSPLNHIQLRRSLLSSAKLIAVGDPRQAIYAFRGADSSSMDNLKSLREDWIDLPLSVTFRCPKVIVARQQDHAPGYTAAESAPEGKFISLRNKEWFWGEVGDAKSIAILCRNNAPIISMALKLLKDLIGVTVLGRDIGKSLIALVKKTCGSDLSKSVAECITAIESWADKEIANARAKEKEEKVDQILDRRDSILAVIDSGKAETLGDIISILTKIFEESSGKVTLSTGHKAKGLEWHTVIHLDPFRVPAKAALAAGGAKLDQELNLKYVIETRAQRVLIEAELSNYGGKEA